MPAQFLLWNYQRHHSFHEDHVSVISLNAVNIIEEQAQLFFLSGAIYGIDHIVVRLVAFCRKLAGAFKILQQLCKFCKIKRAFFLAFRRFPGLVVDSCDYFGFQYE